MRPDGWYDPEEKDFTVKVMLGPKEFVCSCGATWRIAPQLNSTGRYWDYNGECDRCGTGWVNRYHAWRRPKPSEKPKEEKKVNLPYADTI